MGWNEGYRVYEETVISTYDSGTLTPEVLRAIIKPYEDTDIDYGGRQGLKTRDGLSADEVVIKLLAPEFWEKYEARGREYESDFGIMWQSIMGSY